MASQLCSINDQRVTELRISVPWSGVWTAQADFDVETTMVGSAKVQVGGTILQGTFASTLCGTYLLRSRCYIRGGAGLWSTKVAARDYQNDAGVTASTVIEDLARDVGETLGTVAVTTESLGVHFMRMALPASSVLQQVIGSDQWWVDADGKTSVGTRAQVEITQQYEVMTFDARHKVAEVAADDISALSIGAVLRDTKLATPIMIKQMELVVAGGRVRATCWGVEV